MRLTGYRGASSEADHVRLYANPDLSAYWEIPQADIVHEVAIPAEADPLGSVTIWLKRDSKAGFRTPGQAAAPAAGGPGKGCHDGSEEQESADSSDSTRHLVPNGFVGARAKAVPHLLTIPTLANPRAGALLTGRLRVAHQAPMPDESHASFRSRGSSFGGSIDRGREVRPGQELLGLR